MARLCVPRGWETGGSLLVLSVWRLTRTACHCPLRSRRHPTPTTTICYRFIALPQRPMESGLAGGQSRGGPESKPMRDAATRGPTSPDVSTRSMRLGDATFCALHSR